MKTLKKSLFLLAILALCAGAASAGCGVKDTHEGTLESVDAENNVVVVVDADGDQVKLTLTEKTHVTNTEGKEAKLSELVGKKVKVVSEHAKIDSIEQLA